MFFDNLSHFRQILCYPLHDTMKYVLAVFSLLLLVMAVNSQSQDNDAPTGRQGIWPGWDCARQQQQQLMLMVSKLFLLMFYSSFVLLVTGDDDDEEGRWLLQHNASDADDDGAGQYDASHHDVNDEQALSQPQACVHSPCVSSEGQPQL